MILFISVLVQHPNSLMMMMWCWW